MKRCFKICTLSVALAFMPFAAAQQSQPPGLLAQARSATEEGSFQKAETLTTKYLSQNDASADGHYLLGYVFSHEGKAKESLAEYTRAAQLRPPTANDFKVIAVDYVLLGDFLDADKWFTQALALDSSDADGW